VNGLVGSTLDVDVAGGEVKARLAKNVGGFGRCHMSFVTLISRPRPAVARLLIVVGGKFSLYEATPYLHRPTGLESRIASQQERA
jgi:hypothetical protein